MYAFSLLFGITAACWVFTHIELLVLLCSIIIQQYTLQYTIHRDSSAILLLPPDQHHISDVVIRSLGGQSRQTQWRVVRQSQI